MLFLFYREGLIHLSEQRKIESKEKVIEVLNEAINQLEEGLVVKELSSKYVLGRRHKSWLKIKPEVSCFRS